MQASPAAAVIDPVRGRQGIAATGRCACRKGRAHVGGMSLLEMLLVVALIAIVGVVVASSIGRGMAGVQLRGAGKELASQLRLARAQAIARGEVQRFTLSPMTREWQGVQGKRGRLPAELTVHFEGAAQLQDDPAEGVIAFYPDGGSSGGQIRLARNDARWTITVGWLTGEVRSGPERVP